MPSFPASIEVVCFFCGRPLPENVVYLTSYGKTCCRACLEECVVVGCVLCHCQTYRLKDNS